MNETQYQRLDSKLDRIIEILSEHSARISALEVKTDDIRRLSEKVNNCERKLAFIRGVGAVVATVLSILIGWIGLKR